MLMEILHLEVKLACFHWGGMLRFLPYSIGFCAAEVASIHGNRFQIIPLRRYNNTSTAAVNTKYSNVFANCSHLMDNGSVLISCRFHAREWILRYSKVALTTSLLSSLNLRHVSFFATLKAYCRLGGEDRWGSGGKLQNLGRSIAPEIFPARSAPTCTLKESEKLQACLK